MAMIPKKTSFSSTFLVVFACSFVLGLASAFIMLARPVEPVEIPLPALDFNSISRIEKQEHERNQKLFLNPLSAEIRAVGSAYLEWNKAAMNHDTSVNITRRERSLEIRSALGVARERLGELAMMHALRDVRAFHTERFMTELDLYTHTRVPSNELRQLAGALLDVAIANKWLSPTGQLLVPKAILRIRYKLHWTSIVFSLDDCERSSAHECYGFTTLPIEPSEIRFLFSFLVRYPVVRQVDVQAAGTLDNARARRRLVYIERWLALDSFVQSKHDIIGHYEIALARAILLYQIGRYEEAERAFYQQFIQHPKEARIRNWLLATSIPTN